MLLSKANLDIDSFTSRIFEIVELAFLKLFLYDLRLFEN
jgi:hypothetical protein